MIIATRQQFLERWDLIPEILREALVSDANSDFVWKTCEAEHVPTEKISVVSGLTGYVILGFLHPEDMREELQAQANLDPKTSKDIEDAFNQRIFSPLRSEIDKVYQPISKLGAAAGTAGGPKIIQDINTFSGVGRLTAVIPGLGGNSAGGSGVPVPTAPSGPTPAPAPLPNQAVGQTAGGAPSVNIAPLPINKMAPGAAGGAGAAGAKTSTASGAKPSSLSDIGWSKMRSTDPVIQLDTSRMPPTAPAAKPQAPIARQPAPTSTTPGVVMGEFERMNAMKKAPGATATPTATTPTPAAPVAPASAPAKPSSDPAPVMLHEDTTFKSGEKNYGFKLSDPKGNAEVDLNSVKTPSAAKPAVLEFGGGSAATLSGAPTSSTPSPARAAVHYTEFKASLSSAPVASSGPRNINQITPQPPAATPAVPTTPAAPTTLASLTSATKPPAAPSAPVPASAPAPMPTPAAPSASTATPVPVPMPPTPPGLSSQKPPDGQVVVKNFT